MPSHLEQLCIDKGLKMTDQRRVIARVLSEADDHPDVEALYRRAVIVDLLPHDRDDFREQMGQTRLGFDPRDLEKLLTDSGLASVTIRPLPPEPNAKGPALFLATATR